jgi:small subunit ribosomal protein S21
MATAAWTIARASAISPGSGATGLLSRQNPFTRRLGRPKPKGPEEGLVIVQIFVRDNNVDQALKALKKKMQREGTFREMKRHVAYEKPSEKRARQQAEAVRRARKLARKRMQREGLLPPPKPKVKPIGGGRPA